MSVRAGIVVTGTEVLTGRITDRNGPWVAQQLLDMGVDVAHVMVCGDRPADLTAQLRFLAAEQVSLIVTTGGLGPTADDLTVATVAEFCGRELYRDAELERHITAIIARWSAAITDSQTAGIGKQAMIPAGAQSIPPTGTAPGVAIPAADSVPAILILPGPPHELQQMWPTASTSAPVAAAIASRKIVREETIRAFGLSEPDLAATLRTIEPEIAGFDDLEVTTCLRRGEIEIVTRFSDSASGAYARLADLLVRHHGEQIYSVDGSTIDDQLAQLLNGRLIATAESCTGGLVAARLTDRPGSSAYVLGGAVTYANEVKSGVLDVPAELISTHGAVSEPVAAAMAQGALRRFAADTAVATSGVAGPGGGSPDKPVGTVCFAIALQGARPVTTTRHIPGDRAAVRERATTVVMHLLARALRGDT